MKTIGFFAQQSIEEECKNIEEVEDILLDFDLDWNIIYSVKFKDKKYSFEIVDSGRSDEPQYGNTPEIKDFKELK